MNKRRKKTRTSTVWRPAANLSEGEVEMINRMNETDMWRTMANPSGE
jgi:hypothetical protein